MKHFVLTMITLLALLTSSLSAVLSTAATHTYAAGFVLPGDRYAQEQLDNTQKELDAARKQYEEVLAKKQALEMVCPPGQNGRLEDLQAKINHDLAMVDTYATEEQKLEDPLKAAIGKYNAAVAAGRLHGPAEQDLFGDGHGIFYQYMFTLQQQRDYLKDATDALKEYMKKLKASCPEATPAAASHPTTPTPTPTPLPTPTPSLPRCAGAPFVLFDDWNTNAVDNGGTPPTLSTGGKTYCLVSIADYHWNSGSGVLPGQLGLKGAGGAFAAGPLQSVGSNGQNNAPDVNWTATFPTTPPILLNGTYTVYDSSPATWSQDADSNGLGFARVWVENYNG